VECFSNLLNLLASSGERFMFKRLTSALCIDSVSKGLGQPASGPGSDQKNGSVQFENRRKIEAVAFWWAKPGPLPVNPRVLVALARPVSSNLRFCVSGFSIDGRI